MSKSNFVCWSPNDYVPNPQSDRDFACVQMRMSKAQPTASTTINLAAYKPGTTKNEDIFCNSVAAPNNFSVGSRFAMPKQQNMSNSNKMRFEGFQA